MSTPEVPDEQDDARTAEQPPVPPTTEPVGPPPVAPPPAAAPVAGPAGPVGPPPGPPPGYPGYPSAQLYPFTARVREPWLNPAKRGVFSVVAVVLALVLLGGGFVIGAAATHRHDRNQHSQPMRRFEGQPGFHAPQGGQRPGVAPGNGRFRAPIAPLPGNRNRPGPGQRSAPAATPSPAPSSSHS
jgi:hypothetical protein